MTKKIPPPPPIANSDPAFNRWLLELTSILSDAGGVDPGAVNDLSGLQNQVTTNTSDISALKIRTNNQTNDITVLKNNVTAIDNQLNSLSARGEVLNGTVDPGPGLGKVNDWYANTAGAAGHRIFVKTGPATWTAFPF